jgi:cell division protein FtsN
MPSPFLARSAPAKSAPPQLSPSGADDGHTAALQETKPRFDFYKILPGGEEPATPREDKAAPKTSPATESFFLQAGAFQNAADADNLKARLALLGIEATVQSSAKPGRDVVHRVRIGPYSNVDALNRVRDTLKENGVETTLVKIRGGTSK